MSEYLKWYDSYLDHTPTEDLAKNELESAHRKIKHANESLEKANQSVAELQQAVATLEKELLRQCAFMEKTAEKLERHREWQATASVLRRPTREARQALGEFEIEKKRECVSELNTYFVNRANREGEMLPLYFPDWCNDFREQLRKEKE